MPTLILPPSAGSASGADRRQEAKSGKAARTIFLVELLLDNQWVADTIVELK
jgi:hypothetical protein